MSQNLITTDSKEILPKSYLPTESKTFGKKYDKIESYRRNVRVVLYDPKRDKFAVQRMKGEYSILGGGIEEGDTIMETVNKELVEEGGYIDFEIVETLGGQITTYFTAKTLSEFGYGTTCERISFGFLAILKSEKNVGVSLTEFERENGSEIFWLEKEEVVEHLKKQVEYDFGYYYHLEYFQRALLVYEKYRV